MRIFLAVWLAGCALALAGEPGADTFLRDYTQTRGFSLGRPVKPEPTPDGKAVLFLRAEPRVPKLSLFEFDVTTGRTRELASPETLLKGEEQLSAAEKARRQRMRVTVGGFTDFQLSKRGGRVLLSLGGRLYILDRATDRITGLPTGDGAILDPKFSPDGRSVGYVRDHDVCVVDLARLKERAVTKGGTEAVPHGLAEFVAQEEMERFSGWWWSPDARFIAYEEYDASAVEVWRIADPLRPDEAPTPFFYPRPGRNNVRARLGVISVRGGRTTWIRWDAARYPYLVRVDWDKHGGLTLTVQTRDQGELVLLRADPKTGATTPLVTEHDAAWVNIDQQMPQWLDDGSGFLWTSERYGGWDLELRDRDGRLQRVLVPPVAGYQGFVSADEKAGVIYYRASWNPTQSQLWRKPLAGDEPVVLKREAFVPGWTAGYRKDDYEPVALTREAGWHSATFSEDHKLYVHSFTTLQTPPRTLVERTDGTVIGELPSVAEKPPFPPHVEILKVGEGEGFWAKIVRPRTFVAGQRYPVIVHVYGGPTAQMVQAAMAGQLLDQWLADRGFIVVSVDNRGTPGRGRAWERAIRQQFGTVPLEDQIAGLRALGARFPEMDLGRVGIYGWSFGGYATALAVLRRPDVFKAGVAGAPVTDWRDYDTHYTERYLGVPTGDDDPVYRENSLLADAPRLRAALLLIHGTADDNVYFRHSLKLADALTRAGKEFEFLPLAGFTHLVTDPEIAESFWQRTAAFFQTNLAKP